jgi:CheY-like chemotaxis protein
MKLFLSYSRQNEQAARHLYSELRAKGIEVWFDRETLLPGQEWEPAIRRAISESDTVLLLLSSQCVDRRGYFQKEMRLALDVLQTVPAGHIYLLPVRLDNCRVSDSLAAIHYVDLFPDYTDGMQKVLLALEFQQQLRTNVEEREPATEREEESKASVLLVNDEPSTMNVLVDHLRSLGLTVDHAYNVPQAIRFIHEHHPDAVISDLSHFSFGAEVTSRAAFEILELCAKSGEVAKVIVTCAEITDERRQEAARLGAVGICNQSDELYRHLSETTSVDIPNPFPTKGNLAPGSARPPREHRRQGQPFSICLWNMWHDKADAEFARKLSQDLRANGIDAYYYEYVINFGETFFRPLEREMEDSDCVVFLLSGRATAASWLDDYVYKALRRDNTLVIPAILDEEGARNVPLMLRYRKPLDFRKGYEKGLNELLTLSRSPKHE